MPMQIPDAQEETLVNLPLRVPKSTKDAIHLVAVARKTSDSELVRTRAAEVFAAIEAEAAEIRAKLEPDAA